MTSLRTIVRAFNPLGRRGMPNQTRTIDRLKAETRDILGLSDEVAVSVTELSCRATACPGTETVVAVFREGLKSQSFRVIKPMRSVTRDDLLAAMGATQQD